MQKIIYIVKKISDRILKIIKEFFLIWNAYSFKFAIYSLLWWVGFYSRSSCLMEIYTKKKQAWIDKYIKIKYSHIVDKYKELDESKASTFVYNIWTFWGQGRKNMPPLCAACYEQLLLNNPLSKSLGGGHLLDMDSVADYIDIPNIVYEKLRDGKLLFAHFSDILRNSLLAKYGGLWLDATCWTSSPVPEIVRECTFFSPHNSEDGTNWCTYAMGTNKVNSVTFSFVRDMLIAVCENEKVWPDYLFQDRLLDFAYRNIKASKLAISSTPDNSTKRFLLFPMMNKPFSQKDYKNLTKTDWLFKLSYKTFYCMKSQGKPTLYSAILDGSINENQ